MWWSWSVIAASRYPGRFPREDFAANGRWFQRHAVPHVQRRPVDAIPAGDGGFGGS
jgi:hypothetical protein